MDNSSEPGSPIREQEITNNREIPENDKFDRIEEILKEQQHLLESLLERKRTQQTKRKIEVPNGCKVSDLKSTIIIN